MLNSPIPSDQPKRTFRALAYDDTGRVAYNATLTAHGDEEAMTLLRAHPDYEHWFSLNIKQLPGPTPSN